MYSNHSGASAEIAYNQGYIVNLLVSTGSVSMDLGTSRLATSKTETPLSL